MTADVEDVPFCIPAEGLFHPGCRWRNGVCYDGDCEALHISAADREEQLCWDQPSTPQLIITAGPERSGSTWLFNAVRLLFKSAKQPLDSYWLTQVTDEKLADRHGGQPGGHHVLIKTHRWSNAWTPSQADHVFLTHRDLRGVVASYQRMGWAYDIPDTYVSEHQAWKGIANRDLAYEDIMSDPEGQLRALATDLGLVEQVNLPDVLQQLRDLKSGSGAPDPVSKLWPGHLSKEAQQAQRGGQHQQTAIHGIQLGNARAGQTLKTRFPDYFKQYGYN